MQLHLVDGSSELRAWARDLAAGLGFGLGESVPLADPTFLGLMAQALDPAGRPDPAAWVSAAEFLADALGSEVVADERSLAAAALALQVAAAAARSIAGLGPAEALANLDRIWVRAADALGAASPHRPEAQQRLVDRVLAVGERLALAA